MLVCMCVCVCTIDNASVYQELKNHCSTLCMSPPKQFEEFPDNYNNCYNYNNYNYNDVHH